jgi:hypothetical protein
MVNEKSIDLSFPEEGIKRVYPGKAGIGEGRNPKSFRTEA